MDVLTTELIESALKIIGILLAAVATYLTPKFNDFMKKVKEKDNTGILGELAEQAVELIEARFKDIDGNEKFELALAKLAERLQRRGIEMDEESMRMSVQKGWRLMDDKQREGGSKYEDTESEDNELDEDLKVELAELISEDTGQEVEEILEQMEKDEEMEEIDDDEKEDE